MGLKNKHITGRRHPVSPMIFRPFQQDMHLLPVRAVAMEGLPIFGAHAPGSSAWFLWNVMGIHGELVGLRRCMEDIGKLIQVGFAWNGTPDSGYFIGNIVSSGWRKWVLFPNQFSEQTMLGYTTMVHPRNRTTPVVVGWTMMNPTHTTKNFLEIEATC
jgi:hypothetical protein